MKILQSDDFRVGQLVTVYSHNPDSGHGYDGSGYFGMFGVCTQNRQGMGLIYEITAVDLPYVALRAIDNNNSFAWDTRQAKLAAVNREFAEKITGKSLAAHFDEKR